jgi:hypothetical protein
MLVRGSARRRKIEGRAEEAAKEAADAVRSVGTRPDLDLWETLRRAAQQLTPVVIDPGPGFPRLSTFVDSVAEGECESGGALILHPVSVDAIPAARVAYIAIRSCDPQEPWVLTARCLEPLDGDGRSARVELCGAVLARLPRRALGRTEARGREPLVLAVPSGTEDLDGCVFPVHGVSATHAIIEATVPLQPGRTFDPVELIGNRRILRQASATVLEAIPWIEHDGSRRFRCRLLLEASAATPDDRAFDLLSNPKRIVRLLELGCMLTASGWYQAPGWPRGRMRFEAMNGKRLTLRLEQPPPDSIPHPVHVHLGCELFSVSYEMQVRPLRRRGAHLEVTLPLVMRRRRRRREQRAPVSPAQRVWVTFRNPVTGLQERRRVIDLSFGGLCFEADERVDVLWPGIVLEDVTVSSARDTISGGEVEVRSIERGRDGRTVCHAANRHSDRVDDWELVDFLGTLKHPQVEMHDGSDFKGALDLYRRAGLLADFINRNLEPVMSEAAGAWRRLHDRAAQIGCTFMYRGDDGLRAAFSGVRAWERTWLAQHFAALATGSGQSSGAVHLAYFDHVLARPDAHYLAFFVKADNSAMNSFQGRFLELTGTPESVGLTTVELWRCPAGAGRSAQPRSNCAIRPMVSADERLISRAAERSLGLLPTRALSLVEGEFTLQDTSRRFAALSLERRRETHVVSVDDQPALALIGETTSPGVNLTWMLNAWWLLPIRSAAISTESVALAIEQRVLAAPAPSPAGDRFVITVDGVPSQALVEAGFESLAKVQLFVLHRSGIFRYYQHISDRYGEVGALTANRAWLHKRRAAR